MGVDNQVDNDMVLGGYIVLPTPSVSTTSCESKSVRRDPTDREAVMWPEFFRV